MVSNYRKSAGRFGENDDADSDDRPPLRPSLTACPNAAKIIEKSQTSEALAVWEEKSDPILTQMFCPMTISDDDMSSLGNETAGYALLGLSGLPIDKPMSDEEWKAMVLAVQAATITDTAVSKKENNLPPCFGGSTTRPNIVDEDSSMAETRLIRHGTVDHAHEKRPDKSLDKNEENGLEKFKKKTTKTKRKSRGSSERKARTSVHGHRARAAAPGGEGSLSASYLSSSSYLDVNDGKSRQKKKSRKTRPSSSGKVEDESSESRRRRRSRSRIRKQEDSSSGRKHEHRSRSTRRRIHKSRDKDRSVDPQEILDFVSSCPNLDLNCSKSPKIRNKPARPTSDTEPRKKRGSGSRRNGSSRRSSAERVRDTIIEEKSNLMPPSFQMSLYPESDEPDRDCKFSMEREHTVKTGNMSLELAIASKPKPRPTDEPKKGGGHILQRILGNVNHGR